MKRPAGLLAASSSSRSANTAPQLRKIVVEFLLGDIAGISLFVQELVFSVVVIDREFPGLAELTKLDDVERDILPYCRAIRRIRRDGDLHGPGSSVIRQCDIDIELARCRMRL